MGEFLQTELVTFTGHLLGKKQSPFPGGVAAK
jgi:hypothetical protein